MPYQTLSPENVDSRATDLYFTTLLPTPTCDADNGSVYQLWRIEASFHQVMTFQKYPIDSHLIWIEFEDNTFPRSDLLYQRDDLVYSGFSASGVSNFVQITGWSVIDFFEREQPSVYGTDFGASDPLYAASVYSNYRFGVILDRGPAVYLYKLLPPLVITSFITGIVFMMDIEAYDTRIATSIAGLLTLVFLQLQFSSQLPAALNYLTLMDWVFNLGYFLTVATVIECIIVRRLYYRLIDETVTLKEHLELTEFTNPADLLFEDEDKKIYIL